MDTARWQRLPGPRRRPAAAAADAARDGRLSQAWGASRAAGWMAGAVLIGFALAARLAAFFLPLPFLAAFFACFFFFLSFFSVACLAFTALLSSLASVRSASRTFSKDITTFRVRSIRLWVCFSRRSMVLPQCLHFRDEWFFAHLSRGCWSLPQWGQLMCTGVSLTSLLAMILESS